MPNIQVYLDTIEKAILGKDMRMAIHDAIQTNHDAIQINGQNITNNGNALKILDETVKEHSEDLDEITQTLKEHEESKEKLIDAVKIHEESINDIIKAIKDMEQTGVSIISYMPEEWVPGKVYEADGTIMESSENTEETTEFMLLLKGTQITASGASVRVYSYDINSKEYLGHVVDVQKDNNYTISENMLVRMTTTGTVIITVELTDVLQYLSNTISDANTYSTFYGVGEITEIDDYSYLNITVSNPITLYDGLTLFVTLNGEENLRAIDYVSIYVNGEIVDYKIRIACSEDCISDTVTLMYYKKKFNVLPANMFNNHTGIYYCYDYTESDDILYLNFIGNISNIYKKGSMIFIAGNNQSSSNYFTIDINGEQYILYEKDPNEADVNDDMSGYYTRCLKSGLNAFVLMDNYCWVRLAQCDIPTVTNGLTDEMKTKYDNAATNSHTHSNKAVLDGITSDKVSTWDSANTLTKGITLSSEGWWRIARRRGDNNGGADLSCKIVLKRAYSNTNNEHHEVELLGVYNNIKFIDIANLSNIQLLTQIRYVTDTDGYGYIEVYYNASVNNGLMVILKDIKSTSGGWELIEPAATTDTCMVVASMTLGANSIATNTSTNTTDEHLHGTILFEGLSDSGTIKDNAENYDYFLVSFSVTDSYFNSETKDIITKFAYDGSSIIPINNTTINILSYYIRIVEYSFESGCEENTYTSGSRTYSGDVAIEISKIVGLKN